MRYLFSVPNGTGAYGVKHLLRSMATGLDRLGIRQNIARLIISIFYVKCTYTLKFSRFVTTLYRWWLTARS